MCWMERLRSPLALWEREQLCEQSELTTAGEGLIRCTDAKRRRRKASIVRLFPLLGEGLRERVLLEDRKLGRYEARRLKLTEVRKAGGQASFNSYSSCRIQNQICKKYYTVINPRYFSYYKKQNTKYRNIPQRFIQKSRVKVFIIFIAVGSVLQRYKQFYKRN